jgi:hypothetical protein
METEDGTMARTRRGRPRKWETHAERQKAYRWRHTPMNIDRESLLYAFEVAFGTTERDPARERAPLGWFSILAHLSRMPKRTLYRWWNAFGQASGCPRLPAKATELDYTHFLDWLEKESTNRPEQMVRGLKQILVEIKE